MLPLGGRSDLRAPDRRCKSMPRHEGHLAPDDRSRVALGYRAAHIEQDTKRATRRGRMGRLEDKVVIITGAGDGLGAVMAHLFAAEGAKLTLAGRRTEL